MAKFTDVFVDVTKDGHKIPKEDYLQEGAHPIIDQVQEYIAGYSNESDKLYTDVPAIIFGDHTRIIKYVDRPCFLGADGVKLLKAKDANSNYKYLFYALCHAQIPNTGYNRHFKWLKEVEIKLFAPLKGKKYIEGFLIGFDENTVTVKTQKEEIKISLNKIAKINQAIKFD